MYFVCVESYSSHQSHHITTLDSNVTSTNVTTDIDDSVITTDNQYYEQAGDHPPQYNKQKSCDTWKIIVVEEVCKFSVFLY